jgi:hypothetical protein
VAPNRSVPEWSPTFSEPETPIKAQPAVKVGSAAWPFPTRRARVPSDQLLLDFFAGLLIGGS